MTYTHIFQVGPGRYESPQLSPKRIPEGAATAPFSTTEVRDLSGPKITMKETPGPGNYYGPEIPGALSPTTGVVSGFRSGTSRLHEDKSSFVKNPGPGYVSSSFSVFLSFRLNPLPLLIQLTPHASTSHFIYCPIHTFVSSLYIPINNVLNIRLN